MTDHTTDIKAARARKGSLIAKLAHNRAQSLSDAEIERCFAGVVSPNRCGRWTKMLRDTGEISIADLA